MVFTRAQVNLRQRSRLYRKCCDQKVHSVARTKPETKLEFKIYVVQVLQDSQFVKIGASRDVTRRLTDAKFGKAPSQIARHVKHPANRVCIGYFSQTDRARLSGLEVEKLFHSRKEEWSIVGEWYLASDLPKITRFLNSYGYDFHSCN